MSDAIQITEPTERVVGGYVYKIKGRPKYKLINSTKESIPFLEGAEMFDVVSKKNKLHYLAALNRFFEVRGYQFDYVTKSFVKEKRLS